MRRATLIVFFVQMSKGFAFAVAASDIPERRFSLPILTLVIVPARFVSELQPKREWARLNCRKVFIK
jgi:hypothetical protein